MNEYTEGGRIMAKNIQYAYRTSLAEILEGINDLMADLEDIRDEAQDLLDENGSAPIKQDIKNMDEALRFLNQAADALDLE